MEKSQIDNFRKRLEDEKDLLEAELKTIGRINPDNPADWEATPDQQQEILESDDNEVGDKIEGYENNIAILVPLENRYNEIKKALGKIESGEGFGICEIGGEPIELDRLEANPAAATCKAHM